MDKFLKVSTAVTVLIGPFIDDTDQKTAETGLTLAQADIRLSKNAGTLAQKSDVTSCVHTEIGYYTCALDTTDTNTVGALRLMVHQAGSLPVSHVYQIVSATVYDALFGSSGALQVDVIKWNATSLAAPDTAGYPKVTIKSGTGTGEISTSGGKASAKIAAGDLAVNSVTASALAADAVAEIVDGVWGEYQTEHTINGTFGSYLNYPITSVASRTGIGALACTYTLTLSDTGNPLASVRVLVSTDSSRNNIIASDITDQFGVVQFNLDPGTVYLWRYKPGVNFTNPISATFSSTDLHAVGSGTLADVTTTSRIRSATFVGSQ